MADVLRANDVVGVVVPSAALPGTRNVVLFGPRVLSPYALPVVDPTVDIACAHAAERCSPPTELEPFVRWHGEPHAGLESWRAGTSFEFVDPRVPM